MYLTILTLNIRTGKNLISFGMVVGVERAGSSRSEAAGLFGTFLEFGAKNKKHPVSDSSVVSNAASKK